MIELLQIGLIALLIFYIQQKLYSRLWNRNLTSNITFSTPCIFEGEQGDLQEVIENHKRLPLTMIKVKFQTSKYLVFDAEKGSRTTDQYYRNDIFQIAGGEKVTRTIAFLGGRRGFFGIDSMDLVGTDLFLTVEMMQTIPVNTTLYVYPKPFNSRDFLLSMQQLNGEILSRRHLLEDPFEYRGIREYQPFDDVRSINWKATAKTGDLKVTQKNYTSIPTVRIFFNIDDCGVLKKEECVEASFQIAAGLSKFFLEQGYRVACFGNGADISTGEPVWIEEGTGNGFLEQIYRALARVDTTKSIVDFKSCFEEVLLEKADNTFTFFVAPNQYDYFVELVETFQDSGRDYCWFYPVWESSEPELPASLQDHIKVLHIRN